MFAPQIFYEILDVTRFIILTGLTTTLCSTLGFEVAFSTVLILQVVQLLFVRLGQVIWEILEVEDVLGKIFVPAFALTPTKDYSLIFDDNFARFR